MKYLYTSDSHLLHARIITLCNRPFPDEPTMTKVIWENLLEAEATGRPILHGGDFTFRLDQLAKVCPAMQHPERHEIVLGNHDHGLSEARGRKQMERYFGRVHGMRGDWRTNHLIVDDLLANPPTRGMQRVKVLVSHLPQQDLRGCDINVYGHVHNNLLNPTPENLAYWAEHPDKDDRWVLGSDRHINMCVELHNYRPVTLEELLCR